METEKMVEEIQKSKSKNDACLRIFGYCNSRAIKKLLQFVNEHNIDVIHWAKKIKYCPQCGELITKKGTRFCNSSCAAKYNNAHRNYIVSDVTKMKISKSIQKYIQSGDYRKYCEEHYNNYVPPESRYKRCKRCNKKLTKKQIRSNNIFCSNSCSAAYKMHDPIMKEHMRTTLSKIMIEKVKNGTHKGWQSRNKLSYPEQFFKKVFEERGLIDKCRINDPINKRDLGLNDSNNYFLDFHFFDKKLDFEIDGKQHNQPDRRLHDVERNDVLTKNGYIVYRIKWKSINTEKGREYIKNEINKFIQYYNKIADVV